jgi:6-pyruvoyltetrahydropterin/6-carboxytetrahydropterin synthase
MSGMVMDFAILKKIAGDILSEYDHRLLIWSADPIALSLSRLDPSVQVVDYNPTAENLCRILKAEFSSAIREEDPEVSVVEITLWETENSYASI